MSMNRDCSYQEVVHISDIFNLYIGRRTTDMTIYDGIFGFIEIVNDLNHFAFPECLFRKRNDSYEVLFQRKKNDNSMLEIVVPSSYILIIISTSWALTNVIIKTMKSAPPCWALRIFEIIDLSRDLILSPN